MPTKRRRLSDLYIVGKPFTVSDDQGEVEVWLQKLNPLERETAIRKSGAMRARTLAYYMDKESDQYQAAVNDVVDFYSDRESITQMIIATDLMKSRQSVEAEVAADEKWSKDGLLIGLIDSWQEELKDRFAEDPNDVEAKKVFDLMGEFDAEVDERVQAQKVRLEKEKLDLALEELRDVAVERVIETQAINAFIEEFDVQRLLFGVREPDDHKEYYFKDRLEIKALPENLRSTLTIAYAELEVDVIEGKDSPGTEDSSPSSEESGTEDQVPASGLKAVPV